MNPRDISAGDPEPESSPETPLVYGIDDDMGERILAWRDRWIAQTLATGDVDPEVVDHEVSACYRAAGLPEPNAIVHVASPLMVASVGAIAARLGPLVTTATAPDGRDVIHSAIESAELPSVASADRARGGTVVAPDLTPVIEAAVWAALEPNVGLPDFDPRPSVRDQVLPAKPTTHTPTTPPWLPAMLATSSMYTVQMRLLAHRARLNGPVERALKARLATKWSKSLISEDDALAGCAKGPADLAYWAYHQFWFDIFGVEPDSESRRRAGPILGMGLASGWSWLHRDFAIIGGRPSEVSRDDAGELHGVGGPAISWADGWQVWTIHGDVVPRDLAEGRADVTFAAIASEPDEATRRRMIDVRGVEAFLDEAADATLTALRYHSWHSREPGGLNHIFPSIALAGSDRPVFVRHSLCGVPRSEFPVSYGAPRQGPHGRFGPALTPLTCNVCEARRPSVSDLRMADLPKQFDGESKATALARTKRESAELAARQAAEEEAEEAEVIAADLADMATRGVKACELVYGTPDGAVFLTPAEAEDLANMRAAVHESKTWGELRSRVGDSWYEEIIEVRRGEDDPDFEDPPADDEPFEGLDQMDEHDWPEWPGWDIDWLPRSLRETFVDESAIANGYFMVIDSEDADDVADGLNKRGWTCVRDDDLVWRACAG